MAEQKLKLQLESEISMARDKRGRQGVKVRLEGAAFDDDGLASIHYRFDDGTFRELASMSNESGPVPRSTPSGC